MPLLPPRVSGPLSECSRSVVVSNAIPTAEVFLRVTRGGVTSQVGTLVMKGTTGHVPLDPGQSLLGDDLVSVFQRHDGEDSPPHEDTVQVQKSVAQFNPPQVLTHLYECSRGFFLGAMRPGTEVQVLDGSSVIGNGVAVDGTAFVSLPNGIPQGPAGDTLVARQVICPKPPPSPPAPNYIVDAPLPPAEPLPFQPGQTLPAPTVASGLTACSRSVKIVGIQPGAEVILEDEGGAWWASLTPSDQTTATLSIPTPLVEGRVVVIRQEVSRRCELHSERRKQTVGPQEKLGKPGLAQIDCNTTPTIYAIGLKEEADVQFKVEHQGNETIYRTAATQTYGPLPAPPMPVGATVWVRQGECDLWSDWSDPRDAVAMLAPPTDPKISHDLFHCQNAVPVHDIFPLAGSLRVMSAKHGELAKLPISGNVMVVSVAPSLSNPDDVWVEHHFCGEERRTDRRPVKPGMDYRPEVVPPLYDGDTSVGVKGAPAGAHVELWEKNGNTLLQQGRAPFSDTGRVTVVFSGFGPLKAGWKIAMKFWHCGQYQETASVNVVYRPPVLNQILPSSVLAGSGGLLLTAHGSEFRPGAVVRWGAQARTTTFISPTEVQAAIPAGDVANSGTVQVRVQNPDGQTSGTQAFTVEKPPPPPAKVSFTVGIGAFNHRALEVTSATFQILAPGASAPTLVPGTVTSFKRSATAVLDLPGAATGTYHVAVADVQFTYREPSETTNRTSFLSGPWSPTANGSPVSLYPGAVVVAVFAIDQPGHFPTSFSLIKL